MQMKFISTPKDHTTLIQNCMNPCRGCIFADPTKGNVNCPGISNAKVGEMNG